MAIIAIIIIENFPQKFSPHRKIYALIILNLKDIFKVSIFGLFSV